MILVDTSVIADILTRDPDWFGWSSGQQRHLRIALRARGIEGHIASGADDGLGLFFPDRDHQSDHVFEINFSGRLEHFTGQRFLVLEEAFVDRLGFEVPEGLGNCLFVISPDGPDPHLGAVLQCLFYGKAPDVYHRSIPFTLLLVSTVVIADSILGEVLHSPLAPLNPLL